MDKVADYVAPALILAAALQLFWQRKLRTDVTASLVTATPNRASARYGVFTP